MLARSASAALVPCAICLVSCDNQSSMNHKLGDVVQKFGVSGNCRENHTDQTALYEGELWIFESEGSRNQFSIPIIRPIEELDLAEELEHPNRYRPPGSMIAFIDRESLGTGSATLDAVSEHCADIDCINQINFESTCVVEIKSIPVGRN